jgi:hypothetical protein
MKSESDETWLRDRMRELRQQATDSAPPFDRVWRRALAQRAAPLKSVLSGWRLAGASIAALLVMLAAISWSTARRERTARMEREYAEMEGVLMTYWQAPSDTLFPTGDGEGLYER